MRLVLLVVVAMLGVAACGGSDTPTGGGTQLEITLWPAGEGNSDPVTTTLTCGPAGGGLVDPAAACEALSGVARASLDPVPTDLMCTEIYGGPEQAQVSGTLDGDAVDAQLSRVNGCEIHRWEALSAVLPEYQQVEF